MFLLPFARNGTEPTCHAQGPHGVPQSSAMETETEAAAVTSWTSALGAAGLPVSGAACEDVRGTNTGFLPLLGFRNFGSLKTIKDSNCSCCVVCIHQYVLVSLYQKPKHFKIDIFTFI